MSVTESRTLRMTFRNQGGTSVSLSLDNPREDLTAAEIEEAMDLIISKNVFDSNGGGLVEKYDVKIIDQTVTDLYDPV